MSRSYTTVFDVYDKIRRKITILSSVALVIGLLLLAILFGFIAASWKDIFYGMNRVFLLFAVLLIVLFLYNILMYLFRIDSFRIKRLIRKYPGDYFEILNNLESGKVYSNGSADSFLVSTKYCMFYSFGRYHLVRTSEIKKLGFDVQFVRNYSKEIFICLLKNGQRYEMYISKMQALEIADYLKKNDQGIWA